MYLYFMWVPAIPYNYFTSSDDGKKFDRLFFPITSGYETVDYVSGIWSLYAWHQFIVPLVLYYSAFNLGDKMNSLYLPAAALILQSTVIAGQNYLEWARMRKRD